MGKQPGAQSLMAVTVLLRYNLLCALSSATERFDASKSAAQVVLENEKDSKSLVLWSLWEEEGRKWLSSRRVSTQLPPGHYFIHGCSSTLPLTDTSTTLVAVNIQFVSHNQ